MRAAQPEKSKIFSAEPKFHLLACSCHARWCPASDPFGQGQLVARSLDSDPSNACLVVRRRASPPLAPSRTNRVHALSSLHTGVHRAMSLQSALKVLNPVSSSPPARALPARRETWAGPCHAHAHACSLCLQEIGANGVMSAAEQARSSSLIGSAISADAEALAALGEDDARRARALARHSVCVGAPSVPGCHSHMCRE